jgi:hypothetical protein
VMHTYFVLERDCWFLLSWKVTFEGIGFFTLNNLNNIEVVLH